jgi:hypothetical protein
MHEPFEVVSSINGIGFAVLAAGAMNGWGPATLGGLLGAAPVVLGVWLTQRSIERSRRQDARIKAARSLLPAVGDLRDAVNHSQHGNFARASGQRHRADVPPSGLW